MAKLWQVGPSLPRIKYHPLVETLVKHCIYSFSGAHLEGIEELEDHLANSESCLAQTCYLLEWLGTDANQYLQSEAP